MGVHEESDKSRIANKQLAKLKEKIRVAKTRTGSAGTKDPKHASKDVGRSGKGPYEGTHRKDS